LGLAPQAGLSKQRKGNANNLREGEKRKKCSAAFSPRGDFRGGGRRNSVPTDGKRKKRGGKDLHSGTLDAAGKKKGNEIKYMASTGERERGGGGGKRWGPVHQSRKRGERKEN